MQSNEIIITIIISVLVTRGEFKREPLIAHGRDAEIVNFSYSAHMYVMCQIEKINRYWSCGASIVNQDLLLTAGHCLENCSNTSSIIISYGHENTLKGANIAVNKFVVHEGFNKLNNDIALARTKMSLTLKENVGRVALMPNPPYNEKAFVAGWGLIDEKTRQTSPILQFTEQYFWKKKDCVSFLGHLPAGTFCAQNKGCILSLSTTGYAAKGDSGSPLVVRGYIQIGLVSYKIPQISDSVVVYTDTGYFYDWIAKTAAELCEN